jgi:N-acetylneuraminate synthase
MTPPRTFVIAEAGVNHNGSLELAEKLVDVAAAAGADAVKFQTFQAARLVSRHAKKASYQERTTGENESQLAMIQKLELPEADHHTLKARAVARKIAFLSTPFDEESIELLARVGVDRLKISSGDLTNGPLLERIASVGLPVVLSTGMGDLGEVEAALDCLAAGFLAHAGQGIAQEASRRRLAHRPDARALLEKKVTILHCTTEYPAPPSQVNLRAMLTLRDAFGLPVGYSDHTEGIAVSLAAVALGATLIEKHFTLDRSLPGPDHEASLAPEELVALVAGIRTIEQSLGDGRKHPMPAEIPNIAVARRSIVAKVPIAAGEHFSRENLTMKRPGTGISPMRLGEILGKPASRAYEEDELIDA